MAAILETTDLRSGYATGDVLQGVSVAIDEHEIVGVLGRNGVGKSTLMRTLVGLLRTRHGRITFQGNDVSHEPAYKRARRGVGYVPQGREVFPDMSVEDNLRMGTFINERHRQPDLDLVHGYFPFLRERRRQKAGTLSGGQQEMLAIARALVNSPGLLLLDEPSDGVQPSIVEEIGDIIVDLNNSRRLPVLIVEQNIDLIQKVAMRAYVLDKGRVVRTLDKNEIENTDRLAEFLAI
jgi:branched-chain amino acid transport system ATP-binding protein